MSVCRKAPDWAAPQTCPETRRGAPQFGNAADGRQIAVAGHGLMSGPGWPGPFANMNAGLGVRLNARARGADDGVMFRIRIMLVTALLGVPVAAHATAGFAEQHSQLDYTDLAAIHWIHPGDGCD